MTRMTRMGDQGIEFFSSFIRLNPRHPRLNQLTQTPYGTHRGYEKGSAAPEGQMNDFCGGTRSQGEPVADAVGDDEVAVALRVVA